MNYTHGAELVEALRRIDTQAAEIERLRSALDAYVKAQEMPRYGDASGFTWVKQTMRREGDPAWGWICEKHGLGYTGSCICCRNDYEKFTERKDSEARSQRDDALREADEKARAALKGTP